MIEFVEKNIKIAMYLLALLISITVLSVTHDYGVLLKSCIALWGFAILASIIFVAQCNVEHDIQVFESSKRSVIKNGIEWGIKEIVMRPDMIVQAKSGLKAGVRQLEREAERLEIYGADLTR